jgi:hypothetical protein
MVARKAWWSFEAQKPLDISLATEHSAEYSSNNWVERLGSNYMREVNDSDNEIDSSKNDNEKLNEVPKDASHL